ncbi:hypothetical protein [Desulfoluna spongiiphila]|uniref:Uncharacterized protein n=1 Tax=Desulfoluna spongiiphila TaxID=419481 RepID=A0A1G5G342_9BACT|nr:hypothetical protein [Desulfoluna spongiiphila]SCY45759.1 hypothetical protein SAMN05216233_109171 [Desulfoluna spongiiphila]
MSLFKLTRLECKQTSGSGQSDDDVYLNVQVDNGKLKKKVWGGSHGENIEQGDTKAINLVYDVKDKLRVDLWEWDANSSNDLLGSAMIYADSHSGQCALVNPDENDEYVLYFEKL